MLGLPEIALAGRSNVGKSSFINALAGGKPVARTSRTPGRTRSVNFYSAEIACIVDLPGYGYARVSKEERNRWKNIVESYLKRPQLSLVIQLLDVRTGPTESDRMMQAWLRHQGIPTLVVATKADKLGRGAAKAAGLRAAQTLGIAPHDVRVVSAATGEGVKETWRVIGEFLSAPGTSRSDPPRPSS